MERISSIKQPRLWIRAVILAAAATTALCLAACGSSDATAKQSARAQGASKAVVKQAQNEVLGKTVLTNNKGLTLYSLSVEKNGRFVCADPGCLSLWHPLLVPAGRKPTGPVPLGTVRRPKGGGIQVTYRGRPLYHFVEDAKPGEANGEGFKDVGTWHAASPSAKPAPEPPAGEYPGGY
jgi:predicted lipoprotein with Yx(FWY)xxD motif